MIGSAFALRSWPALEWGDVSGWVNGAGALLAAIAAVGIAILDNKKHADELNRSARAAEDRARRRATRIMVIALNDDTRHHFSDRDIICESKIALSNTGDADVYDVQWHRPIVVYYTDGNAVGTGLGSMAATVGQSYSGGGYRRIEDFAVPVLPKLGSGDMFFTVRARPAVGSGPRYQWSTFALVSFVDSDGFRLGWTFERSRMDLPVLEDPTLKGRWSVVDDSYPASVDGVWSELTALRATQRLPEIVTPDDDGYRGSQSFAEYRGPRPGDGRWTNEKKPQVKT